MVDSKGEGARAAKGAAAVPGGNEGLERSSPVLGSSQLKFEGGDAAEMQVSDYRSACTVFGRESDAWDSSERRASGV